ncbi:gephyrin-like molybdotransferase Glp [Marinibactrum halimedae]|uniref:Molybdopterin molybdenumtransferase n=1 Tax=Marinibactrum halimedae TaxID=1444977 RepID=A0AA37WM62_9GAMM|nr:gephyrin-like molybdotransferase Glp [Marinibactrum halimedae]MCD9458664.1 molybdopterin molybdotransferase MoeA [Marinibactrum halimedae]GLS25970.1 molybdopterin molybdenumtransferase MoeA [Marinibactrum halimedae]
MTPIEEALAEILSHAPTPSLCQETSISNALGAWLSNDIVSTIAVPPHDNSAMDGYAFHTEDVSVEQNGKEYVFLPISQRIAAGQVPAPLVKGTAARIFTGATLPEGANAVVMQEACKTAVSHAESIGIPLNIEAGNNIRPKGQDIQKGQILFRAGHRLQPQDIGLLASIGLATVRTRPPLRVAILSTGDELLEPGMPLEEGKIYNSNRFTLSALLQTMGMHVTDIGRIPDNLDSTRKALEDAAAHHDCIISSGGVSVGEEDHVKAAMETLGKLNLWRLAIKPGKPLAFGNINNIPFFGLPGNPVAVFNTFLLVVKPFLERMLGSKVTHRTRPFIANFSVNKPSIRQDYLRVSIRHDGRIERFSNQSSGVLSSLTHADGLAIIPVNQTIQIGDKVEVLLLKELIYS